MIKNFLLDLIFPRFCLGCQKELNQKTASFTCEECLNKIILNGIQCHVCGLRSGRNFRNRVSNIVCRKCREKTFLKGLFAVGRYQDPVLREAINQLKYQSIESLKKPLAELLIKYIKKENLIDIFSNSILAPIPLSWRRKLKRGFNQSELLAKELSSVLHCPVVNLLKRQKFNAPQAKITDWKKRKENISGAFAINSKNLTLSTSYPLFTWSRKPDNLGEIKRVILVDDVSTSGATLEEAARILKEEGIKEVYGLVVAKG